MNTTILAPVTLICALAVLAGSPVSAGSYSSDAPRGRFSNDAQLARNDALAPFPPANLAFADTCEDAVFEPGIDARGRRVVPADVPRDGYRMAPPVVGFDLAGPRGRLRRGNARRRAARHAGIDLGEVTVDTGSGLVSLNGAPLNPAAADPRDCFAGYEPHLSEDTLK